MDVSGYTPSFVKALPSLTWIRPSGSSAELPRSFIPTLLNAQGSTTSCRIARLPELVQQTTFQMIHWKQEFSILTGLTCGAPPGQAGKLSLRYSVWSHDPTNDLRVIRFCLSTPMEQFVHNGMDRALDAHFRLAPDSIRLNQRTRGIQATDSIHRMRSDWPAFIDELDHLSRDSRMRSSLTCLFSKKLYRRPVRNGSKSSLWPVH